MESRVRGSATPRDERELLSRRYREVRRATEELTRDLTPEDQQLQSMPVCSPAKWHRAHTTWFFETFLLTPSGVPVVDTRYGYLFNSYYEAVGPRHARPKRGLLSRPSAAEVGEYRAKVDGRMLELIAGVDEAKLAELAPLIELGLAHEEQHQELILTDILNAFSQSSLLPCYRAEPSLPIAADRARPGSLVELEGGLVEIGASTAAGFSFDNEGPRHRVWLEPFAISDRLLTVREMRAFIREGGYESPALWLSEGWDFVRKNGIEAPLYARTEGEAYITFSLHGEREAHDDEPVAHLSYYEADALARFLGGRLPTEAEWEHVASRVPVEGRFRGSGLLRPRPAPSADGIRQLYGDAWEWTCSAYAPYPGFRRASGAVGEYNGKFMVGQMVMRGGSALSPEGHLRATYRNFWHPDTRFQLSGARLCKDIERGGRG
jgi:ergothioneine biosynthesis protein EgtB